MKGPKEKKNPLLEGTEDKSHSATYKGNTKVKIFQSFHVLLKWCCALHEVLHSLCLCCITGNCDRLKQVQKV